MVSVHTYEERFWRDFCDRSEAAPRRSLKWRLTYRIRVHAASDSFSCGPIRPYSVDLAFVIASRASVALLYAIIQIRRGQHYIYKLFICRRESPPPQFNDPQRGRSTSLVPADLPETASHWNH